MNEQVSANIPRIGLLVFKSVAICCLFVFIGKPLMNSFSGVQDVDIELSEEESEKDLEEKEETKVDELDKLFGSFQKNSLVQIDNNTSSYFQNRQNYSEFRGQVLLPPPEFS